MICQQPWQGRNQNAIDDDRNRGDPHSADRHPVCPGGAGNELVHLALNLQSPFGGRSPGIGWQQLASHSLEKSDIEQPFGTGDPAGNRGFIDRQPPGRLGYRFEPEESQYVT